VRTPTDGVPCSDEALAVIDAAQKHQRDGYLFANAKKGVISDAAMSQHMKRAELGCTPHGFRTSLREWLDEKTDARYEVAEMMLGHKRRELLERWAAHVTSRVGKNYRARVRL
jgi:integrase